MLKNISLQVNCEYIFFKFKLFFLSKVFPDIRGESVWFNKIEYISSLDLTRQSNFYLDNLISLVLLCISRYGRKPLLLISGTAMTICLGVLGYYFKFKSEGGNVSAIGWLPLTCLALFNIVFSLGYGSVPFTIMSEILPAETKGIASSMSIVVHWSLVFAVTKLFPTMEDQMGQSATFWTFACFTTMSVIFTYFLLPETKGKTLQEIQKKLEGKYKTRTEYSVEPI